MSLHKIGCQQGSVKMSVASSAMPLTLSSLMYSLSRFAAALKEYSCNPASSGSFKTFSAACSAA